MIGCFLRKCRLAIGLIALVASGSLANAQEITVVPLSQSAAASTYAVSPHLDGVTFVGDVQDENCFLIVVDGDVNNAHQLTVRPEGALIIPSQTGLFALASPIIQLRDGHYAVSFVAIPVKYQGTNSETSAKQEWMARIQQIQQQLQNWVH